MNVILLTLFFLFFSITNSFALINPTLTNTDLPAVIKAKKIEGDKFSGNIIATGNVEISKNNSTIFADKVLYNKDSKNISGSGNILIKNLEVGKLLSPNFIIKDDFSSGLFFNSRIFFTDGSYIFSKKISRISPKTTKLEKFEFSICPNDEILDDNKKAGNLIDFASISSSTAKINQEDNSIISWNSIIKIYNVPVIYIPYLNIPLPSKERRSGFLKPSYARNSNFGFGARLPYFIDLGKSQDLTITPLYFFSSNQFIINNQWRQYSDYGKYFLNVNLANNKLKKITHRSNFSRTNKSFRWQVDGKGNFDFTNNIGLDFDINTSSDKDYLRDYNFEFQTAYSVSKINLDYIYKRNYYSIKTARFQENEFAENQKLSPFILPSIDAHIESNPMFFKEKFLLDTNLTMLKRSNGLQYKRLSIVPEFKIPLNLNGNLFEFATKIQRDEYLLNSDDIVNKYKTRLNDTKTEASINWSFPLRSKSNSNNLTIEPMANFVFSNYQKPNNLVPMEDSVSSELTFSNLFVNDRISGYDRNESGKRISYGAKSSLFNKYGEFNFTVGQALLIKSNEQDFKIRGFASNNKSNIVGIASFQAKKNYSISYAFQLDQKTYRNEINQLFINMNFKKIILNIDYLLIRKNLYTEQRRQHYTNINSIINLPYKFQFMVFTAYDFEIKRNISKGLEIRRFGCCTDFAFTYTEYSPLNLTKPEKNYKIEFTFKNI